ncbi:MAG: hypothetical protein DWQ04_08785 [Chloroflexi bacterium]|nr:MAG: hypothetical protein DWQ04_08785 [Chloroflexota bacterium]
MKNKPFFKVGFLGIGVIVASLVLMAINPSEAPKMPDGFSTPILAFEFVVSEQEVVDLFGSDPAVQAGLVRAFDLGSWVDFAYMLLYAGFLFLFAVQVVKVDGRSLFYLGAALAVIIFLADLLENVQLLGITARLDEGEYGRQLTLLPIFTWIKWGSLAIYFLLLTPYFFTQNLFARIIGILSIVTFTLGGIAFLNRSAFNEYYAKAVAVMFVLMIVYSFITKSNHEFNE